MMASNVSSEICAKRRAPPSVVNVCGINDTEFPGELLSISAKAVVRS
jgi:hypothetical protein